VVLSGAVEGVEQRPRKKTLSTIKGGAAMVQIEPVTPEELEAYINGFYDAMDLLKQQETATIQTTQNLINQF